MPQIVTDYINTINQLLRCLEFLMLKYLQYISWSDAILSTDDISTISCSDGTHFYWWDIYNQSAAQMHPISTDDIYIYIYSQWSAQIPHISADDISTINQLLRCHKFLLMTYLQSTAQMPPITTDDISTINQLLRCLKFLLMTYI